MTADLLDSSADTWVDHATDEPGPVDPRLEPPRGAGRAETRYRGRRHDAAGGMTR